MAEEFNKIWAMIMPYVTNTAVMTVIMAVVTALIKGSINKKFNQTNMSALFNRSFDKTIGQVQQMTFSHDIQPLVESALVKIQENATANLNKTIEKQNEIIKHQTMLLGELMHYFDNSIGITPEQKAKAQAMYDETIAICENDKPLVVESKVAVKEEVVEPTKVEPKAETKEVIVSVER